jgi:hypothetical protein
MKFVEKKLEPKFCWCCKRNGSAIYNKWIEQGYSDEHYNKNLKTRDLQDDPEQDG